MENEQPQVEGQQSAAPAEDLRGSLVAKRDQYLSALRETSNAVMQLGQELNRQKILLDRLGGIVEAYNEILGLQGEGQSQAFRR